MEKQVKPGQVYKSVEDHLRFNRYRTLRVERVGPPHTIYPGRLKLDGVYAFCVSNAAGKKPRKVVIEAKRLLTSKFELIEQLATIGSGQEGL